MAPAHGGHQMPSGGPVGFYHSSGMHPNAMRAPHGGAPTTHTNSGHFGPRFSNEYYGFNNYAPMQTHEGTSNHLTPEKLLISILFSFCLFFFQLVNESMPCLGAWDWQHW